MKVQNGNGKLKKWAMSALLSALPLLKRGQLATLLFLRTSTTYPTLSEMTPVVSSTFFHYELLQISLVSSCRIPNTKSLTSAKKVEFSFNLYLRNSEIITS